MFWTCPSCAGRLVGMGPLRKELPRPVLNAIWAKVRDEQGVERRTCPCCSHKMREVYPEHTPRLPALDVCRLCHVVWFDPQEFEILPRIQRAPDRDLYTETRRAIAARRTRPHRHDPQPWAGESPAEWWQYIPALFGMPVEVDGNDISSKPWVTWATVLAVLVVTLVAVASGLDGVINRFGLIPAEAGRHGGLTFFLSFFLHAGWVHLLGNLYFLWVFGDNVEDYLGPWSFLLLLAAASLAGDLAHIAGDPRSMTPVVGASGGISGVITFYALKFPHVRLGFIFRIFLFRWVHMPAYFALIVWVSLQAFGVFLQLGGFSNVSALSHLGGALVGALFWVAMRQR